MDPKGHQEPLSLMTFDLLPVQKTQKTLGLFILSVFEWGGKLNVSCSFRLISAPNLQKKSAEF